MAIQYSICSNKPDTTGGRVPEEQHFQDFQPDSSARHSGGGEHSFPVSSGVPASGRHHPHLQCKDGKVTVAYFKFLHFICTINFFFGGGLLDIIHSSIIITCYTPPPPHRCTDFSENLYR